MTQFAKCVTTILFFGLIGCGEWGWEKMESDYEPELNIFGFISTDSVYSSFVSVHQTLKLDTPDYSSSLDTVWVSDDPNDYWIRRISSYVVPNATVTISNGNQLFTLFYVGSNYIKDDKNYLVEYDSGMYVDTLNQLKPQPNEEYILSVSTPDGRHVSGSITTPFIPNIKASIIPDTISLTSGYSIEWNQNQNFPTLVWVYKMDGYAHDYGLYTIDFGMLEANDTIWYSEYVDPTEYYGEVNEPDSVVITVMSVDQHYYDYFHNQPDEFISLLIGSGNSFSSVNVDGGLGLYTSMSASRVFRVITK